MRPPNGCARVRTAHRDAPIGAVRHVAAEPPAVCSATIRAANGPAADTGLATRLADWCRIKESIYPTLVRLFPNLHSDIEQRSYGSQVRGSLQRTRMIDHERTVIRRSVLVAVAWLSRPH